MVTSSLKVEQEASAVAELLQEKPSPKGDRRRPPLSKKNGSGQDAGRGSGKASASGRGSKQETRDRGNDRQGRVRSGDPRAERVPT